MSDVIISVENLGKKYKIRHQGEKQRYTVLRDVLAQKFAAPFKFLRRSQGSEVRSQVSDLRPPASSRSSSEDFWALKDVSFEVKRGEVVGIKGCEFSGLENRLSAFGVCFVFFVSFVVSKLSLSAFENRAPKK